jgi:hypothetical protein
MLTFAPNDALDQGLIMRFFWLFSSFEGALKKAGFLLTDGEGNPSADWDGFYNRYQLNFSRRGDGSFPRAMSYLARNPPQRQIVVRDGPGADLALRWAPQGKRPRETDSQFAWRLVRTVRNSLFHGGKYPHGGTDTMVERDQVLLAHVVAILEKAVTFHPGMKAFIPHAA